MTMMMIVVVVLVHLLLDQPVFSSQDSRNCLEFLVGIFLMSVTCSCLNVVFTIGWRVGCKFRNRWCCSYWGRPLDANSYWGGGLLMQLIWCSSYAAACMNIMIGPPLPYHYHLQSQIHLLYRNHHQSSHIIYLLKIISTYCKMSFKFFAKYLPYSAYDCGNDMDLRRHLHCWCYGVKPCSQTIDLVYKCGLK